MDFVPRWRALMRMTLVAAGPNGEDSRRRGHSLEQTDSLNLNALAVLHLKRMGGGTERHDCADKIARNTKFATSMDREVTRLAQNGLHQGTTEALTESPEWRRKKIRSFFADRRMHMRIAHENCFAGCRCAWFLLSAGGATGSGRGGLRERH